MIFVFGSNLAGIHGAGAARYAHRNKRALWGLGQGFHGESYAIPTKDQQLKALPLDRIQGFVERFIQHAMQHPNREYMVTRIGCGLAGYADKDIAPMFVTAPDNCLFDEVWEPWLPGKRFWGTL